MALATKPKKTRARPRRVMDMTPDELRALIETLIDRKLANGGVTSKLSVTPAMRQRAISAAGRFCSGHSEISQRHDEHLSASYLK
jgi:hypothetical protein